MQQGSVDKKRRYTEIQYFHLEVFFSWSVQREMGQVSDLYLKKRVFNRMLLYVSPAPLKPATGGLVTSISDIGSAS